MAFNLEPSFYLVTECKEAINMPKYTTEYLHDDEILEITENEKTTYHIKTFLNAGNYPCLSAFDLPKHIEARAKYFHAWQSDTSPIIPIHRLIWVLYHDEDIACDRLKHTGKAIHHKDHDRFNADIKNLECLTYNDHKSKHSLDFITLEI